MRESTHKKLFKEGDHYHVMTVDTLGNGGLKTMVDTPAGYALVIDYPRESDGFEVYLPEPSNSIVGARKFLGLE